MSAAGFERGREKCPGEAKAAPVTLKGCKIVRQEGQRAWLAMLSVKLDRGWNNVVELSKPLRERATEVVLAAWATHQPAETGRTAVHRNERRDPRQERIEELAAQFDTRGPDEELP